jgi:ribosome maturation factor RimP
MTKKEQQLEALIAPSVNALGLRVWGIEYLAQGKRSLLRVYIDADAGVTIDDCERVSKQVSDLLDVEDVLAASYTLEVSSPGMDRLLFKPEQYAESIGETVDIRLNYPFEGRRRFVGSLTSLENDELVVQVEDSEYLIPLSNVQRARIVPQFE